MPTKNPRLNITMEPAIAGILQDLAKKEDKSISGLARDLIIEALELREDYLLSDIAARRDTKNKKKVSHKDAWS